MSLSTLLLVLAMQAGAPQVGPTTVVGTAKLKWTAEGRQASAQLVFSAARNPSRLRLEVLQGSQLQALVWCDREDLRVYLPQRRAMYSAEAGREAFEAAFGLPFCLDELLFALRGGYHDLPRCAGGDEPTLKIRGGKVVGVDLPGSDRAQLRFSRFGHEGDHRKPGRVQLRRPGVLAVLTFGTLREGSSPPPPIQMEVRRSSRPIDAAGLRAQLGLEPRR
ncbi:MAG: hypothetical protein AAF533_00740 [Acidobacteriota bacterium]